MPDVSRPDHLPHRRSDGQPPHPSWLPRQRMAADGFADYRLAVGGLVDRPVELSLEQLRELGRRSQIVKHNCIQGWTAIAQWGGVPLSAVLDLVGPRPQARYVVFYAMDDKGLTEGEGRYGFFYDRWSCTWPPTRRQSLRWR